MIQYVGEIYSLLYKIQLYSNMLVKYIVFRNSGKWISQQYLLRARLGDEALSPAAPSPPATPVAAAAARPAGRRRRRQPTAAPKLASRRPPLAPLSLNPVT